MDQNALRDQSEIGIVCGGLGERQLTRSLPLVHLSLLRPILSGLRERGVDPAPVLEGVGLTESAIMSDDVTVHVLVIHQFLENAAASVGDPSFAASIGLRIDPSGWPMIQEAEARARSLGDYLNIYVSLVNTAASSVTAYLDTRGEHAHFGETRHFKPTFDPAQNDGFMVSLALSILRRALAKALDPSQVSLVVCNPTVLPDELSEFQALRGDRMGFRIMFPAVWLSAKIGDGGSADCVGASEALGRSTDDFLASFRNLLGQHVGTTGLSAEKAAELVAMSPSKLARRLSGRGTDISTEIARVKLKFARRKLSNTTESIGEIAAALSYADPANFTRAFRRLTGVSPTEWRRLPRTPESSEGVPVLDQ